MPAAETNSPLNIRAFFPPTGNSVEGLFISGVGGTVVDNDFCLIATVTCARHSHSFACGIGVFLPVNLECVCDDAVSPASSFFCAHDEAHSPQATVRNSKLSDSTQPDCVSC